MPPYYRGHAGFSYFFIPDRLLELRPQMDPFDLDLWLLLHKGIQHNQKGTSVLLTDDQIAKHAIWGQREINAKEISRARALLKKLGVLSYRKQGLAWQYYAVHPLTGIPIDPEQAEREQKEVRQATAEASRVTELEAKIASLEKRLAKPTDNDSGRKSGSKTTATEQQEQEGPIPLDYYPIAEDYDPLDTGQVEE